jgi:hypothetical protein
MRCNNGVVVVVGREKMGSEERWGASRTEGERVGARSGYGMTST